MHTGPAEHLVDDLESALDAAPVARMSRRDVPLELLRKPTIEGLLIVAAVDWCILGAAWVGMAVSPGWTWPFWALVVTSRLHAFGVILHDAAHMPLKQKTAQVRLLEVLCGYPLAITINAMRYHHLRHHRDNGMPTDPYFKTGVEESWLLWTLNVVRGVLLIPFWTVRPYFAMLALARPGMRNAYGRVFLQDKSGEDLTESAELLACAREDRWQLLAQLPLLVALFVWPSTVLWYYGIPVTISGILAAWRLLVEHRYTPAEDRRIETILATTNDHHVGGPLKWLLAPRNIGFHIVHHIHPQVAHDALPALRDWYLEHCQDYPEPR